MVASDDAGADDQLGPDDPSGSNSGSGVLRVLLVDDSPDIRLVVRTVLSKTDKVEVVAEAPDAETGIVLAEALQPDLIVLDLMMPGIGGMAGLPQMLAASPGCRVVVFSSLAATHGQEALANGAAAWVEKGGNPTTLADEILTGAGLLDAAISALYPRVAQQFAADIESPRQARAFAREFLGSFGLDQTMSTVELLLSELVTNAVIHASSAPAVSLRLLPDRVHIEVTDSAPEHLAPVETADDDAESGRGLALIDALATSWGTVPAAEGKVVWFDVPRS